MSQEFIDELKKSFRQAEGDLYEAVYWIWDAINKEHGRHIRKILYGDERMRNISRQDFKNFFAMAHTAIDEFNAERKETPPSKMGDFYAEKIDDADPSMNIDFSSISKKMTARALFDLPEIQVPKVTKNEILDMLRARVNEEYMPSSVKKGYNSKPDYIRVSNMEQFMRYLARETVVGFYTANDEIFFMSSKDVGLWAVVPIGNQANVFVNLKTQDVYIGRDGEYIQWDNDLGIAINRNSLMYDIEQL